MCVYFIYIYTHIITYAITQYNAVIQSVKLEIDPSDPVRSERRWKTSSHF